MAAADLATRQWGYVVGGTDTDARTVTTDDIYVKRLILTANDSADTITVTEADGTVIVDWTAPPECVTVVEVGAKLKGLIVTPSATDDYCSIIVE